MDVGCGTGILSLLAARAGAKRVFAVEASKIADKAERNIKASGYSDVITYVFRSGHLGPTNRSYPFDLSTHLG